MSHMCGEGHIDAEIFALFLSAGVYQTYAGRFLSAEQIDAVDIARYMPRDIKDAEPMRAL